MTSSQTNTFQSLLARFSAFSALDSEDLTWLAERAKPYHCSIGQELLSAERMPEICYCIIEGRGRVLHNDPGLQRPVTLAYAQPGDLIGWSGLARRSPCEWITAVTPMKLIGFSAEDFYQLEQRSKAFADWLDTNNSPAELMAALAPALRRRPQAYPPERDVLRRLLAGLTVLPARDQRQLPLDDGAVWLWNAQPEDQSVPVGSSVNPELLASITTGSPCACCASSMIFGRGNSVRNWKHRSRTRPTPYPILGVLRIVIQTFLPLNLWVSGVMTSLWGH